MSSQEPTWSEVLRDALAARIAEIHTSLPAVVDSFTSGPPATVTVTLGVDFHRRGDDAKTRERYTPPQLANVPVVYPGAGGSNPTPITTYIT